MRPLQLSVLLEAAASKDPVALDLKALLPLLKRFHARYTLASVTHGEFSSFEKEKSHLEACLRFCTQLSTLVTGLDDKAAQQYVLECAFGLESLRSFVSH